MTHRAARALTELAAHLLGPSRRDWGLAMQAELGPAIDEERGLQFACGCLFAAAREIPTHPEGRLTLTAYAAALGLVLFSAALLCAQIAGHPFAPDGRLLLNEGQVGLAPSLALLGMVLAAAQLVLAWFVTERDWPRAFAAIRLNAAMVGALVPLTAFLPLGPAALIASSIGLLAEAAIFPLLARWHERLGLVAFRSSG